MRTIKTIFWVLAAVLLMAFIYINPAPITVRIWPGNPGISVDTKAWALIVASLLVGFVPTWLIMSAQRWRMARRIAALESTLAVQSHTLNTHAQAAVDPVVVPGDLR